jgi:hypothetical protein
VPDGPSPTSRTEIPMSMLILALGVLLVVASLALLAWAFPRV